MFRKSVVVFASLLVSAVVFETQAFGVTVDIGASVVNPLFAGSAGSCPTSWVCSGSPAPGFASYAPTAAQFLPAWPFPTAASAPTVLSGSGIIQQTTSLSWVGGNMYVLKLLAGVPNREPDGTTPVVGWAQTVRLYLTAAGNAQVAAFDIPNPGQGAFASNTLSFTLPNNSPFVGQKISVLILVSATQNYSANLAITAITPPGSCQGSSSLSALVSGTNVTSYIPKANWSGSGVIGLGLGVSVVNVEGTSITNTLIPTPSRVNSCASNSVTGQTVCTANNTDVYVLLGTTLTNMLTSGGSNTISFSGGAATNTGVAMDGIHNKAVIGLSIGGVAGFQFLDLGASPTFEPVFTSQAGAISEDPLLDPTRNLLLSATETNKFEIVNVATTASPAFFERSGIASGGELDSTAEDCSTGIALAPAESLSGQFGNTSSVFIADLSQAVYIPGSPGTWTAPSMIQSLTGSSLSFAASGSAVAQGTHAGVLTGEFGGNNLTAIALPTTSGIGTPAVVDWITCNIDSTGSFQTGADPHTVTAYQSPNGGDAIALLANLGATQLARVDLTLMLALPKTNHVCNAGSLPAAVVTIIPVP